MIYCIIFMSKRRDDIGKIFGCYKVLEYAPSHRLPSGQLRTYYLCQCQKCGNFNEVSSDHLIRRNYQYCPKCERPAPTVQSLVGQKFGRLTVLDRVDGKVQPNGACKVTWRCQCDCGNTVDVTGDHLKDMHTTSCGCLQREIISNRRKRNLLGKRFGKLLVIKFHSMNNGRQMWECLCDCGRTRIASTVDLTTHKVISCGCSRSIAEYEFTQYLESNNIQYVPQYKFADCKYKRKLPFDFGIFYDNDLLMLVELHGQQHYYPYTYCSEDMPTKIENYEHRKMLDDIKQQYCIDNGHKLLIIKYSQFSKKEQIFANAYAEAISAFN